MEALKGTARPRSRSGARSRARNSNPGSSDPGGCTHANHFPQLVPQNAPCSGQQALRGQQRLTPAAPTPARARRSNGSAGRSQRSTQQMTKDGSEAGWGGTSPVVNATDQPLQPQTVQTEARQVSARICSEQSSAAAIVFPRRGMRCVSRALYARAGQHRKRSAQSAKTSPRQLHRCFVHSCPRPAEGNAHPGQLQVPGEELARQERGPERVRDNSLLPPVQEKGARTSPRGSRKSISHNIQPRQHKK